MFKKFSKNLRQNKKGSTIVELIVVIVLLVVLIPSSLGIFISARKISGQSYVQHQAAVTLSETNDIIQFLRNQGFNILSGGEFYMIRNPGAGSWLVKSELPDMDTYERLLTVESALRHQGTDNLYMPGDSGPYYEDVNTKKIGISILWAPDYLSMDLVTHTIYITNWQKVTTYSPV